MMAPIASKVPNTIAAVVPSGTSPDPSSWSGDGTAIHVLATSGAEVVFVTDVLFSDVMVEVKESTVVFVKMMVASVEPIFDSKIDVASFVLGKCSTILEAISNDVVVAVKLVGKGRLPSCFSQLP